MLLNFRTTTLLLILLHMYSVHNMQKYIALWDSITATSAIWIDQYYSCVIRICAYGRTVRRFDGKKSITRCSLYDIQCEIKLYKVAAFIRIAWPHVYKIDILSIQADDVAQGYILPN